MSYLLIIILGCYWSLKKRPRNKAEEVKDMIKGNYFNKFKKEDDGE